MNRTNEEKILDILAGMQGGMLSMDKKMDSTDIRLVKVESRLETEIMPKIDALAEGHTVILERLVPVTRVDELENEVKFLKSIVRQMPDDNQKLKQAQ